VNPAAVFIRRPVATILLTIGIALVGIAAYFVLPVASLPAIDIPAIGVSATLPGASPEVMATSVATPLERRLGHIASVTDMTSSSQKQRTQIVLQFDLDRDINGAARDVQAAINAARSDLPATLRSNPTYQKFNPADAPVISLALTSPTLANFQVYDAAATILQQKLSQVPGVGQVDVQGSASPAVRIDLNPRVLSQYGIGLEDVRAAVAAFNPVPQPKGALDMAGRHQQIYTNDLGVKASDYSGLIIGYRNGAAVRLSDVAHVYDGAENIQNIGLYNGKPSINVNVRKEAAANVVDVVDRIKALLPELTAQVQLNGPIDVAVTFDRTTSIRSSLFEVERTLLLSVILVVVVVLAFLRNGRATVIPAVAVVVSLLGTLAVMFLFGFSLDNLSLMSLTVATGFVVDDAIVVLENITRHTEAGMPRFKAALLGSREVSFTVISISISLIAVFIPILFMGGIPGRLFREFAVTLAAAVMISLVLSLTTTPMLAARLIDDPERKPTKAPGRMARIFGHMSNAAERAFTFLHETYEDSLSWALNNGIIVLVGLFATVCLTVWLYIAVPKGFFPQQDTGQLQGGVQVDQASSFNLTGAKFREIIKTIMSEKSVQTVTGFSGSNGAGLQVQLRPKADRPGETSDDVINRLRPRLLRIAGAQTFLQVRQDIGGGGRQSNAQYQYTLESDDLAQLKIWAEKLTNLLKADPTLQDVNSDQQDHGLETFVTIDRDAASRLGLTTQQIDDNLNDAFGQRLISTIYNPLNQYHVTEQVAPDFAKTPEDIGRLYVAPSGTSSALLTPGSGARPSGTGAQPADGVTPEQVLARTQPFVVASRTNKTVALPSALTGAGVARTSTGGGGSGAVQNGTAVSTSASRMIPLPTFGTYAPNATPVQVNHQNLSVSATISFNLPPGKTLSDAQTAIQNALNKLNMPNTVHGSFRGTAQQFQQAFGSEPVLILGALMAVYIVLGVLYESYVHPITVLSTLPSAGVGAVGAMMLFHVQFDLIGMIGIVLLIGIVKKNAILIIDFALAAERDEGMSSRDAIHKASMLRFRPILMTTAAAILGALPLALGFGEGGELRRPLGIAIIGGLVASQVLTLLTTPVVYLYMDKLRKPRKRSALGDRLRNRPPSAVPARP
jgi:multidrug efflux pump